MPRIIVGILASLGFLLSTSVNAASFDCSKASSPYEKAVCSNPNLSSLDDQLAGAYKDARAKSSDPDGLKKDQIEWIKSTRQCASDVGCIEKAYKSRIAALGGASQLSELPKVSQGATASSIKSVSSSDSDAYKFYVQCYGPARLAALVEPEGSKNTDTFISMITSYQLSAEDLGKKLGYPMSKVTADLDRSADLYKQPFLEKNHKNNAALVQASVKKHEQEQKYCLDQLKANKELGKRFFDYFNSIKK